MKYKYIILIVLLPLFNLSFGQSANQGNSSDIALKIIIPEQEDKNFDEYVQGSLNKKLTRMAVNYGFGSEAIEPRFIFFPKVFVNQFETVPGSTPKIIVKADVDLYIADYKTKTIFATTTVKCTGVGDTERHAYHKALSSVNTRNANVEKFMKEGKEKIIDYYARNCDLIIKNAETFAYKNDFDQAFYMLSTIPFECTACYQKMLDESKAIYDKYLEYVCKTNFVKAQSIWISSQNYQGAINVEPYLSEIIPGSSCYNDVQEFIKEIKAKVLADENKEWNFMLHEFDTEADIERQRIQAIRDVGVAYGNNQPDVDYNIKEIFR
jgi:hypothetical protein